jgi:hypothetical protein
MLQNQTKPQEATKVAQQKAERIKNEGYENAADKSKQFDDSFFKPMLKDAWGRVTTY